MNPWMLLVGVLFLMALGAVAAIVLVLTVRFMLAFLAAILTVTAGVLDPAQRRADPRTVCWDDDDEIAARHHLHGL